VFLINLYSKHICSQHSEVSAWIFSYMCDREPRAGTACKWFVDERKQLFCVPSAKNGDKRTWNTAAQACSLAKVLDKTNRRRSRSYFNIFGSIKCLKNVIIQWTLKKLGLWPKKSRHAQCAFVTNRQLVC